MTVLPAPVVPSPKFQLKVYGEVPPVTLAVKVTGVLTAGLNGVKEKLVANGSGGLDPKISVIGAAAASLAVRVDRAQLFSSVWRIENSS